MQSPSDPTPQPHGATDDEPRSGTHGTYRGGWLNGRRIGWRDCALTHGEIKHQARQECQATHLESERAWYGIGARIGPNGDRDARWYSKGLSAGLRSGRRQGVTSGVTRGLLVAFGLALVAGAMRRRQSWS